MNSSILSICLLLGSICPSPAPIVQAPNTENDPAPYPPKKGNRWKTEEKKSPSPRPWSPTKK